MVASEAEKAQADRVVAAAEEAVTAAADEEERVAALQMRNGRASDGRQEGDT